MELSEQMRSGGDEGRPDITWSVGRTNATIDLWADKVEQLEAKNKRLRRELALLKKGWRTGSVEEFLADITTLENEVIRLEDELDAIKETA